LYHLNGQKKSKTREPNRRPVRGGRGQKRVGARVTKYRKHSLFVAKNTIAGGERRANAGTQRGARAREKKKGVFFAAKYKPSSGGRGGGGMCLKCKKKKTNAPQGRGQSMGTSQRQYPPRVDLKNKRGKERPGRCREKKRGRFPPARGELGVKSKKRDGKVGERKKKKTKPSPPRGVRTDRPKKLISLPKRYGGGGGKRASPREAQMDNAPRPTVKKSERRKVG